MRLKIVKPERGTAVKPGTLAISAEDFSVSYDNHFSLHCPEIELNGKIIAVLGHNGAGKSTLIKSILGLIPIKRGKLNISYTDLEGKTLDLFPEKHMAFCPESGAVFSDISVESYIRLWCRIKQNNPEYYKYEGQEYLELFELEPLMKKAGRELSKGQKRRVQSAIGFLTSPSLFLFDEPFDGLDVQKTQELSDIIRSNSHKMSFLISSHRMDVIERLADLIIVLREGRIFASGKVPDVCKVLAPGISSPSLVDAMNYHLKYLKD